MIYGRGTIALIYVDGLLFFGPKQDNIDEVIKYLEDSGLYLTVEEDVYDFMGFVVTTYNISGKVTLNQRGLTKKVMKIVVMLDINKKNNPEATMTLGTYDNKTHFYETWEYASILGMLMYLSRNSRPEIQFEVHQCTRLTHNPRKSHA